MRTFLPVQKKKSRLIIGPWDHDFIEPEELKLERENILGRICLKDAVSWFRTQLMNEELQESVGIIKAYSVGKGCWEEFRTWPPEPSRVKIMYMDNSDKLQLTDSAILKESAAGFIYDPLDPVPTHGGSALLGWLNPELRDSIKHGSVLQPEAGYRDDVLSFKSSPLMQPMQIAGRIRIKLYVSSTAKDTAFTVKICEELSTG